jgi:bacteriorhodopsin
MYVVIVFASLCVGQTIDVLRKETQRAGRLFVKMAAVGMVVIWSYLICST